MAATLTMTVTAAPRILVVDDTPALLDVIRTCLEDEGYHVRTCLESRFAAQMARPGVAHVATSSIGAALQNAASLPRAQGTALADLARHAYTHAFDQTLVVSTMVALLASVLVAWLLRPQTESVPSVLELAEAA